MQENEFQPTDLTSKVNEDTPAVFSAETPLSIFKPWQDTRYIWGILCLAFSLGAFYFSSDSSARLFRGDANGFWFCHIFTITFWAVLTFSKKADTQWFRTKIDYTLLLMVLMQVGAFALNDMDMDMFPPSVIWLLVQQIILQQILILAMAIISRLSRAMISPGVFAGASTPYQASAG